MTDIVTEYTQVGTNGYFTFAEFDGYSPFLFDESTDIPIVAPFFTDIDISNGVGDINYEIHTRSTSEYAISQVDSVINEQADTNFNGRWMLVSTWDSVPPLGDTSIVSIVLFIATLLALFFELQTNTFQGVLVTDYSRSFAVFTYNCGDLDFSNGATIGFSSGDGLFANHPAIQRGSALSIACLNQPVTPWVNVVYELTREGEQ